MLKVMYGTNLDRQTKILDAEQASTTTLRSILDEGGIDYNHRQVHLSGEVVTSADLDKTFAEMGRTEGEVFLVAATKADSAR